MSFKHYKQTGSSGTFVTVPSGKTFIVLKRRIRAQGGSHIDYPVTATFTGGTSTVVVSANDLIYPKVDNTRILASSGTSLGFSADDNSVVCELFGFMLDFKLALKYNWLRDKSSSSSSGEPSSSSEITSSSSYNTPLVSTWSGSVSYDSILNSFWTRRGEREWVCDNDNNWMIEGYLEDIYHLRYFDGLTNHDMGSNEDYSPIGVYNIHEADDIEISLGTLTVQYADHI